MPRTGQDGDWHAAIATIYRAESRFVLATLIRLLGGFDHAEEALHDAFAAAAEQWPREGLPANPRSWLISVGRFQAINRLRRRARFDAALGELARQWEAQTDSAEPWHWCCCMTHRRRAKLAVWRAGAAAGAGSRTLEPGADRRRRHAG
jgi:DNA-directed RNA polymerase specialized sigma24 family protein